MVKVGTLTQHTKHLQTVKKKKEAAHSSSTQHATIAGIRSHKTLLEFLLMYSDLLSLVFRPLPALNVKKLGIHGPGSDSCSRKINLMVLPLHW